MCNVYVLMGKFTLRMVSRRVLVRVGIDFTCLTIIALPIAIFNFVGKPFRRGFFCDDESLMHPYKPNTIPTWLAIVVATSIPTVLVVVVEIKRQKDKRRLQLLSYQKLYRSLYRTLMSLLFGFAATQLCTDIGKYSIGRLRPHFLSLCNPRINCTNDLGYIELDVCTTADKAALREARLSFPSGHASVMMYSMLFVVIYVQRRMQWRKCWLLRPFIQLFMFLLAYYTCMSRISDYMHHWSDVLGGSVLGITVSFLTIYFTTDIMSDITCCQSIGVSTCDTELPLYKSTRQNEDRISVKTSSDSTLSNGSTGGIQRTT